MIWSVASRTTVRSPLLSDPYGAFVSDESGAQTCITKAQLDTLLPKMMAEAAPQSPAIALAATAPHSEPTEIATVAAEEPLRAPIVAAVESAQEESQEPEHTGTVTTAISGAALA